MRKPFTALLVFAAMLSAAAAVHANDGAAERAAGGLVFKQNDDVDMVSEDLFISVMEVRVRYVFRNRTPRDTRITVAFPLPDYDLTEPAGRRCRLALGFRDKRRWSPGPDRRWSARQSCAASTRLPC